MRDSSSTYSIISILASLGISCVTARRRDESWKSKKERIHCGLTCGKIVPITWILYTGQTTVKPKGPCTHRSLHATSCTSSGVVCTTALKRGCILDSQLLIIWWQWRKKLSSWKKSWKSYKRDWPIFRNPSQVIIKSRVSNKTEVNRLDCILPTTA